MKEGMEEEEEEEEEEELPQQRKKTIGKVHSQTRQVHLQCSACRRVRHSWGQARVILNGGLVS